VARSSPQAARMPVPMASASQLTALNAVRWPELQSKIDRFCIEPSRVKGDTPPRPRWAWRTPALWAGAPMLLTPAVDRRRLKRPQLALGRGELAPELDARE